MKILILVTTLSLFTIFQAQAKPQSSPKKWDNFSVENLVLRQLPDLKNVTWKVGDYQERVLKKSGIKGGSLVSWVDREEGRAIWLLNDLKIIFKKKQHIEVLVERKTGKILKYIVDGEEKTPPDITKLDDCVVLEEVKARIKVPAGQFITDRTAARCDEDAFAIWVNEAEVNMGGYVRLAGLDDKEDPSKPEYVADLVKFGRK